jgi:hypothetical protein
MPRSHDFFINQYIKPDPRRLSRAIRGICADRLLDPLEK